MNDASSLLPRSTRRDFLVQSAAAGALVIGWQAPAGAQGAATEINLWVAIHADDRCVVRITRSEMGQGTLTGLAQLVAEELECDWTKVSTEQITPQANFASKRAWGEMGTGGSRGIRTSHDYVRRGGAAARLMLVQAAADQLKVPVSELRAENGVVIHAASGRRLRFGELAAAAAKLPPPDAKSIVLKDPKTWKVAGTARKRLDTGDKLDGSKTYAIDVRLPGQLYAAIRACPVWGGKLVRFDAAAVTSRRGVRAVVPVNDRTVAVVADTWWRAKTALDALPITWDEGAGATQTSAAIARHLQEGLDAANVYAGRSNGDALKAIAGAAKKVEATYGTPFLAHACMEPMNCTARITADKAEVWVATQNGEAAHAALSESSGLPLAQCEVTRLDLGGGFGRRGGLQDYVRQAVAIAKQLPAGTPVQMIWSREEDQAQDFYRPISMCKLAAGIDASGALTGLHVRVSGQSINAFVAPATVADGKDRRQLQGFWEEAGDAQLGYTVPNLLVEYAMRNTHAPVGPWRGVNTNQNGVYMECFIDEVARAAGADPLAFRRTLMGRHPKHLAVLNAAAERAGWGRPLPAGVHRGIAQFMGYGSYSAAVAEVSVSAGKLKVHRLVLALDCGHAVNPDQIAAQVEGSVAYGLSAAFYGEITIDKGRAQELNFHNYPILKLAQMPKVETVIVPSHDFWGGVGEPTICVVTPSVLNAIHAATGKPVRTLPLRHHGLV